MMRRIGRIILLAAVLACMMGMVFCAQADAGDFVIVEATNSLTQYTGNDKHVVIPDSLGLVEVGGFSSNGTLVSVVIPEGVQYISNYAFYDCRNLRSVQLPSTLKQIGHAAFSNCDSLTTIILPEGLTDIDSQAFSDTANLKSIQLPSTLKNMGWDAFARAAALESINIPAGVSVIPERCFEGCTSLRSIQLPNSLTKLDKDSFAGSGLVSIDIPAGIDAIWDRAFKNCASLQSVKIPEGVTAIREQAFQFCTSLTNVEIPRSLARVFTQAFEGCIALESMEFYEGLNSLDSWVFNGCTALKTINLPQSLVGFDSDTFAKCANLVIECYEGSRGQELAEIYNLEYELINRNDLFTISYTADWNSDDGEDAVFTIQTGKDTEAIAMHQESGALVKKFTGAEWYTESNDLRTWTLRYTFNTDGERTMTFKKLNQVGSVTGSKAYTFSFKRLKTFSAAFGSASAVIKQPVGITVKTNMGVRYLHMYSEGGAEIKLWDAETHSRVSGNTRIWNVEYAFSGTGKRRMSFRGSYDKVGWPITSVALGTPAYASVEIKALPAVTEAVFTSSVAYKSQKVAARVTSDPTAEYLSMYAEGGDLVKTWRAADHSTLVAGKRVWTIEYAFGGTGSRSVTFKASTDGRNMGAGKSAGILVVYGAPAVSSAQFGKSSAAARESVAITIKTNADAKYLKMYAENGAAAKTWTANESNSRVNGTERIWTVDYAFASAGKRKLSFKASKDGKTMGSSKSASIQITADYELRSVEFGGSVAYKKESVAVKASSGADAKYLHMYDENGKLVKTWAADSGSSVQNGVRKWTLSYAFGGTGLRKITFKASQDGVKPGSGKQVEILIVYGTPAVSSVRFGASSVKKGEKVNITVATNADAKYLKMYAENGAAAKTWTANESNSRVNGTERIWSVSHTFTGAGARRLTFRASKNGSTMGDGITAGLQIK